MFRSRIVFAVLLLSTLSVAILPAQAQESAACAGKAALDAGATTATLDSGGLTRIYNLFIPSGYDSTQATALVLSLHGAASRAAEQQENTGWDAIAERETFIMAYPQGALPLAIGWRWKAGEPMGSGDNRLSALFAAGDDEHVDDVVFIGDLLTHLADVLCIDPARVYVNGFSNGGGMTYHLGCVLAERIAAIGTNAGAYTPIPGGCSPSRPLPVITFQGKLDRIVPYDGNPTLGIQGVESWVADWVARNACDPSPVPINLPAGAVTGLVYTQCDDDVSVEFYAIADGGHTWPGGTWSMPFLLGKTNTDINASEVMWTFFAAHPMK